MQTLNAIQTKEEYVFSDLVEVEETTELKTKLAYNSEKKHSENFGINHD